MSSTHELISHLAAHAGSLAALAIPADPPPATLWQPVAASTTAHEVDWIWDIINWISYVFFALIVLLMVVFVVKYRHRKGTPFRTDYPHHNTPLELGWSIGPTIIVIALFWAGFAGYLNIFTAPKDSYEIQVTAQKWAWSFKYPNGATSDDLYIPSNRPVRLVMRAQDVLHSFYIPEFRVKKDCVPGRYSYVWFQCDYPTGRPGPKAVQNPKPSERDPAQQYHVFCAEYCGQGHSNMNRWVYVLAQKDFDEWVEGQARWIDGIPEDELYFKAGPKLYARCAQCHSLDGTPGIGPTWKGIVQRVEAYPNVGPGKQYSGFEQYVSNSILNPGEYVVPGFGNAMPTFKGQIQDRGIEALIGFMKHLDEFDPKTGAYLKGAAAK